MTYGTCPLPRCGKTVQLDARGNLRPHQVPIPSRADPTIAKPMSPKEQADAVLAKPLAGLKAMQAGAAKAGVTLTSKAAPSPGPALKPLVEKRRKDRTDFGSPPKGKPVKATKKRKA